MCINIHLLNLINYEKNKKLIQFTLTLVYLYICRAVKIFHERLGFGLQTLFTFGCSRVHTHALFLGHPKCACI